MRLRDFEKIYTSPSVVYPVVSAGTNFSEVVINHNLGIIPDLVQLYITNDSPSFKFAPLSTADQYLGPSNSGPFITYWECFAMDENTATLRLYSFDNSSTYKYYVKVFAFGGGHT